MPWAFGVDNRVNAKRLLFDHVDKDVDPGDDVWINLLSVDPTTLHLNSTELSCENVKR
jgi:hypothetical protein